MRKKEEQVRGAIASVNQENGNAHILSYFRARFYSAELGRFISRDPIGFVDGMSLYRAYFVPGAMDPEGLKCGDGCCVESADIKLLGRLKFVFRRKRLMASERCQRRKWSRPTDKG